MISPAPNSWTSKGSSQRMSKRCGKLGMTLVTDFSIVVDIKASPDENWSEPGCLQSEIG